MDLFHLIEYDRYRSVRCQFDKGLPVQNFWSIFLGPFPSAQGTYGDFIKTLIIIYRELIQLNHQ